MPSTSCTCVGGLSAETFLVIVVDPTCKLHGDRDIATPEPSQS